MTQQYQSPAPHTSQLPQPAAHTTPHRSRFTWWQSAWHQFGAFFAFTIAVLLGLKYKTIITAQFHAAWAWE